MYDSSWKLFETEIIPFLKEKVESEKHPTMNIPMLEENAKILAARFPIVLDRILQTGNRLSDNFFYEGEGRNSSFMQQRGENAFPVYGTRDKAKLIKRWFDGLQLDSESLYAVTGFGDGSHIKHFLDHSSTGAFCLAAEKDPCCYAKLSQGSTALKF